MKTLDVSDRVMDRVVGFEKFRTHCWLWMFRLGIGLLSVVLLYFLWRGGQLIAERGTLELLGLLREDREIIREYWRDTADIIIAELPQGTIFRAIVVIGIIFAVFLLTRRRRNIIRKKLQFIIKLGKKR
ncbi:hypothetical protein HY948_00985 [Candidatus Gottesmanbacteria bacterium]|nr:hypothetical protein [Candidatus Gottesmanbacteria bacterium]